MWIFIAAPSAAPLEVEASSNSSYNITIQWSSPPEIDRNGVIVYYEIHVTETETGNEFRWTSTELNTTLGSLHAYYHYDCRVAAHTAAGTGPFSTVEIIQTLPAGMLFIVVISRVYLTSPEPSEVVVTFSQIKICKHYQPS